MRMMLGDTLVEVPSHRPQPGRVLVRTEVAAVVSRPARRDYRQALELVRDRFSVATTTLRLDGPAVVLDKARHMFQREAASTHRQYTAFSGRRADTGAAVAGFSLTHPRVSELVLTRPEQIWDRPADVTPELAALTLFGGAALSALDEAAPEQVHVPGDSLLAELLRALAQHRRLELGGDGVVLAAELPGEPDPAPHDLVIGCVGLEDELRAAFPGAREVRARSQEAIVVTDDRHVDLFYSDGPVQYPDWFDPQRCAEYLEAVGGLALTAERGVRFHHFPPEPERPDGTVVRRVPRAAATAEVTVGLVGAGRWPLGMVARQMELAGGVRLKTVYDRRPEACRWALQALPFEQATTEPQLVLDDPEIDVVVVAPYHGSHAEVATAALRAGKHCFLEKPAAVTFEQFWALAEAAAASDKVFHVGNNRRFAPFVTSIRDELAAAAGPTTVQSYMRAITIPPNSWYYWPSQGSRVISNVCHVVDLAIALCGDADPVEVETRAAVGDRVSENVTVAITFADGSLASLVYTNRGKSLGEYYEKHTVARGDRTGEIEHFRRLRLFGEDGVRTRRGVQDFGHRTQIEGFLHAVRGAAPQPVDLRVLLVSAYAALAADQSLRDGAPVALPLDRIRALAGDASPGSEVGHLLAD